MEIWEWDIYGLNGWGIYGLNGWGKMSYCFLVGMCSKMLVFRGIVSDLSTLTVPP